MNHNRPGFHFQPLHDEEIVSTENASLLFNCQPPGRKGRVTVFLKTRRTLRKRLGVHDLGQIESVLQDTEREIVHDEMKRALTKMTNWRYLFPPEMKPDPADDVRVDSQEFRSAVERSMRKVG